MAIMPGGCASACGTATVDQFAAHFCNGTATQACPEWTDPLEGQAVIGHVQDGSAVNVTSFPITDFIGDTREESGRKSPRSTLVYGGWYLTCNNGESFLIWACVTFHLSFHVFDVALSSIGMHRDA